jgi:hypothetical protein
MVEGSGRLRCPSQSWALYFTSWNSKTPCLTRLAISTERERSMQFLLHSLFCFSSALVYSTSPLPHTLMPKSLSSPPFTLPEIQKQCQQRAIFITSSPMTDIVQVSFYGWEDEWLRQPDSLNPISNNSKQRPDC